MDRMIFKSKLLLVLILLIPLFLYILYVYELKNGEPKGTTRIFEVKNTQMVSYSPGSKIATIEKHFMIIKSPENLYELKTLVEEFHEDNPINLEIVVDEIKKARNIDTDEIKKNVVYLYFYRESSKLPKNWKPNEAYMFTDRIEHHKDDCIASIVWSDSEPHKRYDIMRKSSNKDDYGSVIEEIDYIDNEIVNQRLGSSKN